MSDTTASAPALISMEELIRLLGRSRSSIERDLRDGKVPHPVGAFRARRWRRAEIEEWIEAGCPSAKRWKPRRTAG